MYMMKATSDDPLLGRMIRGYCLEELLGRGSLTAVYRARTEELWQVPEVVITVLLVPETLSAQARTRFRTRFMREARRLALLRHHYLFPLFGYGEQDGLFYLLTPPVQGEALTKSLRQKGHWSSSEALTILVPLAAVLDFLHSKGLRCQFFNPANVLIQSDKTVLLSGLGLSQLLSVKGLEKERKDMAPYEHLKSINGTFLGLPEYLAPEVVKGAEADSRSDVYALGILLFELLSGEPPFAGKSYLEIAQKHVREPLPSLHTLAPDMPVALEVVLNRALHRNPDHRFQTLKEFVAAYAHVVEERIKTPTFMNLAQTLGQMKALPVPKLEKAVKREENGFLLAGNDALFPEEARSTHTSVPAAREAMTRGVSEEPAHTSVPMPAAREAMTRGVSEESAHISVPIPAVQRKVIEEPMSTNTLVPAEREIDLEELIAGIRKDLAEGIAKEEVVRINTPAPATREVITENIKIEAALIPFAANKPVPVSEVVSATSRVPTPVNSPIPVSEVVSSTSLVPASINKPTLVNEAVSATYSAISQPVKPRKEQTVVAPEMDDDLDEMDQTAKVMSVSTVMSRLQVLKQQLDAQPVPQPVQPPPPGGKTDGRT